MIKVNMKKTKVVHPRKCGVCGKRGHNKRSHENGRLKGGSLSKAR